MQLRRIEIRDFRKLDHRVVEGLGDGLNVVVGDNEAGKSTVLAALRAALFERHRVGGEAADRMLPYRQDVRPEVHVEFELEGKPWRLRKAFCQRPEAELAGPGGERWIGDAVEDRLAELFGFTPPGKGGSQPAKHQGAYGLLWVEQGAAHRSLGIGAGRDSIASALEREVGQVLGGERGRALLAKAEERKLSFWGRVQKPVGTYRLLGDEVGKLEERKADLQRQLSTLDAKVAELDGKQEALARHAREDRLSAATRDLAAAREAAARTAELEAALKAAGDRCALRAAERDRAATHAEARTRLLAKLDTARGVLARAQAEAEEARGALASREAAARAGEERLRRLRAAARQAEGAVVAIDEVIARRRAGEELRQLDERLAGAEAAETRRREADAAAATVALTEKVVAELEGLQREADRAGAELAAASVRIVFSPDGARLIAVDGVAHEADAPLILPRDAELTLEGFGRLAVRPGGGVANLARRAEAARDVLEARLRQAGVADLAEARATLQRRLGLGQEAMEAGKVVRALAPDGLDALRRAVEAHRARLARPLPETAAAHAAGAAELDEARRAKDAAARAVEASEVADRQGEAARAAADRALATCEERAAGARRDHDALGRELADARALIADESLAGSLSGAAAALAAAASAEDAAQAALAGADPEVVRLRLVRAERAEQAIRSDIETLTREKERLEIELTALGREGLGEQLAAVEGELELKVKQRAAKDLEAAAARLLHEMLAAAQRESKDRWLGPVRAHVKPYLRLLQPDSDIVLNEDTLELDEFVRNGVPEPFGSLSVGAREQVAVVTRLALADILRGSGRPSVVILDDALVNTDEGRLDRMHDVLHKAAENLQIVILTCRERDFMRLGAPITRLR